MRRTAAARVCFALILGSCICPAQNSHYIEIKLPPGIPSETVFIRYLLAGDDFGDWVRARPGVSSYFIGVTRPGRPATRIKAILHAPGCAIQTLDRPVSASNNPPYSFVCQPLANISISGALTRMNQLLGREVKLRARYIARWAPAFLEIDPRILTAIPVGDEANVSIDGHFRLSVPDFSQDPLASAPDHLGELQLWAQDKFSQEAIAELIPAAPKAIKTRMGAMKIQSEYPEITFTPCVADLPRVHDAFGFALPTDDSNTCER
jgi:hypothetical protein